MKKQFEAWYMINYGRYEPDNSPEAVFRMRGDDYYNQAIRMAWDVWQASRATCHVALPRCWNDEQRDYRDALVDELDDAGVTYQ